MRPNSVVIVGGGLAAAKTAEHLRADGFDGPITLIGAEEHLPYERPALSKDYLAGKVDAASLAVHAAQWYADHVVDLRLGVAVVKMDRAEREVLLADGSRIGYGALVLANAQGVDKQAFFRKLLNYGALVTLIAPVVMWLLFVVLPG